MKFKKAYKRRQRKNKEEMMKRVHERNFPRNFQFG